LYDNIKIDKYSDLEEVFWVKSKKIIIL
jgi:hypothetical protein